MKIILAGLLCMLSFTGVKGQTPLLEKTITVKLSNVKLDAALNLIAEQGKFTFSYNPGIVDLNRTINLTLVNKTIRESLDLLFNGRIEGKAKGNYIILVKAKEEAKKPETKSTTFTVSGYVLDEKGAKVPWASIYNKKVLAAAVSDNYGYFKLELPKEIPDLSINVSKKEYADSAFMLKDNNTQFVYFTLTSIKKDSVSDHQLNMDSLYNSAEESARSFFMTDETFANTNNINDTIYQKAQISVIPFVGTNGKMSGNVINDYSLNIFGGYSMGTRKAEVAGLFNVDRGDVRYCQLAGIANASGGNVEGCQIAGISNAVKKDVRGFQCAGIVNLTWGNFEGCEIAGYVNTVKGKTKGVQVAGFVNTVLDTSQGVQIAGFCNVSPHQYKGTQISGFANVAVEDMTGTQISFFNYARHIKGSQVGFFNYSNTCSGIPVGFMSYVSDGYHKLEVSADEIFYVNLAYRGGVNAFHNIITAGIKPSTDKQPLWTFGYGLGSTVKAGSKVKIDFDISCNQIVKGDNFEKINLNNKFYIGCDIALAKKMSLAIGGTINGQLTDSEYDNYPEIFTGYKPHIFYSTTYDAQNLDLRMWFGAKAALRFF